jgi:hypothetical protein
VFQWQDVPQGQQVPITRAVFDQGGYQLFAATGETIVVPFVNQNLYAMKFGRTGGGQSYFVNEGDAPVLYLRPGDFLENAAAQNARWYPLPDTYPYTRPVYVSLAPSWNDYIGMGWYPGMVAYGGLWGYRPYGVPFAWMPSFSIHIGGTRYTDYVSYRTYYTHTPGYSRTRIVYNNYGTPRGTGSWARTRTSRTTGSFRSGSAATSTGSFRARGFSTPPGSFGTSSSSSGGSFSFGRRSSSTTGSFSGSAASAPTGSFGGTRSFGSGSGSTRSFGRSSSSSFGGTRTYGSGSFGGGGRSSGSFGGGTRSSSFGSRRSR